MHKQVGIKQVTYKTDLSGAELLGIKQRSKQVVSELSAAVWYLKSFGWCNVEEGNSVNIQKQINKQKLCKNTSSLKPIEFQSLLC